MRWASLKRKGLMEQWAAGGFSASFTSEMIAKNAGATGACSVYEELIDLQLEDLNTELSNDK